MQSSRSGENQPDSANEFRTKCCNTTIPIDPVNENSPLSSFAGTAAASHFSCRQLISAVETRVFGAVVPLQSRVSPCRLIAEA